MSLHEIHARDADALYDGAPCGLLLTAADGRLLRANTTFCNWIGHAADALVGRRRFADLLTMGGRIFQQTHLTPLLQLQGSVSEVKLDLVRADGERIPAVVNVVRRHRGDTWTDEIAVLIAKDRHAYERELMLARKRAEELAASQIEVQRALREADQRKDEFLAMLAHELRNPLAPISTAAQLLRMACDDPARVRPLGELIGRQTAHLTHLVDDLLDVSRVTRGLVQLEEEVLDLEDVADAAVEQSRPLIESRAHRLVVDAHAGIGVRGDRTRLVQVLANLLNNAAKYTPPGGRIELRVDATPDEVQVDVCDDGLGIDASLLPHVFELFSQGERTPDRAQGGLGIGLALVRSLVGLHGGTIEAHSDGPLRGSRFTVRLPRIDLPAARSAAEPSSGAARPAAPLDILVVDDNADAAWTLAEVLTYEGHRTVVALNAADALQAATRTCFDVCVLDIGLPDMTGHELAGALRQRTGATVYVALTGYGQPRDRVLSQAAGFDHHLVKPVDIVQLGAILATAAPRLPA